MEISKELLSKVLAVNIRKINNSILDGNLYYYKTFVKCKSKINIYELSHKCKAWAFKKGFAFRIEYLGGKDINIQLINCRNEKTEYSKDFYNIENIEHIAVPCQWILDNKKDENVTDDK